VKLDRRVQRTRQGLQEALVALILEKGYEAVTVQDIIDRANVGRATFYAHFHDKEDLLLSEFEHLSAQFEQHQAEQAIEASDLWTLGHLMFQHAQSYQRIYKAVVGKQSGLMMQSHLQKFLSYRIGEALKSQGKKTASMPREILIHHLVHSLMALLVWWLDNNLPYSAEQMGQMYEQLTKPGVMAILQ
jgi:AcrR family transcriptional regulator